jgi:hypothetical protein
VALACPPDIKENLSNDSTFDFQTWTKTDGHIATYPRDGTLPWLGRVQGIMARIWMYTHGYRMRIDWQEFFTSLSDNKILPVLQNLDYPKLFVHSRGDAQISYQFLAEMYEKVAEPKELTVVNGGNHSLPLMRSSLRKSWIEWVTNKLHAEDEVI